MSAAASAPNCRCRPATGGAFTGSVGRCGRGWAPADAIMGGATMAPTPRPAVASNLRRLSSTLNVLSRVVMEGILDGGCIATGVYLDFMTAKRRMPPSRFPRTLPDPVATSVASFDDIELVRRSKAVRCHCGNEQPM
jgi:hypothetical protein